MSLFNMTENLFEFNDLPSNSNSYNVTNHGYAIHTTTSMQSPSVFPHVAQRFVQSPTTPHTEPSPLIDIPHADGVWNHIQLEKPASMLNETVDLSQVVYPFNVVEASRGLDSFSKTFPAKNPNGFVGKTTSNDSQLSEMLLQRWSSQCRNELMHHPPHRQSMTYNPYQGQHYGYQNQGLGENNLVSVPFNKSQGQDLFQHQGNQIHQQQRASYPSAQQKQQIPLNVQEGRGSIGSPTDSCTKEQKASEQIIFQASLNTPYSQGSPNILSLSHPSNLYQHQPANELTHKPSFEDQIEAGGIMPSFFIQREEAYTDLNYHHKQEDFWSYRYQSVGSGGSQTAQPPSMRGGVLHQLNSYKAPCEQLHLSEIQKDQQLLQYRTEAQRAEWTKTKLKCILCQRKFKSLPALNGHMRSHGGSRTNPIVMKTTDEQIHPPEEVTPADRMVFPVSVPVKDCLVPSRLSDNFHNQLKRNHLDDSDEGYPRRQKMIPSRAAGDGAAKQQKKLRYRRCLVPLVIFPCAAGLQSRGPVLFHSRLRSPGSCSDDVAYTPPPMLSPVRPGSGLFSSVNAEHPCTGAQAASRIRLLKESDQNDCNAALDSRDNSNSINPQINIGCNFQAEIPDIRSRSKVSDDTHKANLLWTPCYLDTYENQQRVDDLLKMACSSVLPGGGTNTEYTLHCLFECKGDIITTLESLLSVTVPKHRPSLHTYYHYAGSDKWTLQEKRQLNKALLICNKDFHLIQKMVKTKSVAQCVEYYYTWKEKLRLGRRFSTGPITPGQAKEIFTSNKWNQCNTGKLSNPPAEYNSVKSSPSNSSASGDAESNHIFPCTECGKVFLKVKSRNAHMKTHRQLDDAQIWQLHCFPAHQNTSVTPASPTVGLPPVAHYSVAFSKNADIKPVLTPEEDESLLQNHNLKE